MNEREPQVLTHVTLLFRAVSDRTRLRILYMLKTQPEVCVGDFVEVLGVPQPTASRHLAYLRRAGLVHARKDGVWAYYSLAPGASEFHRSLWACLGTCFKEARELATDAKRLARLRTSGGCCPR